MTDTVRAEIAGLRTALAEAEQHRVESETAATRSQIDSSFEHGDDHVALAYAPQCHRIGP